MPSDGRRYLDPAILSKVGRLDLVARLVVEGAVTGLHRSPYHGFSVEFAEHREYTAGDDIRHVDWKVYGRTDRFYIKQYEEETNLTATLLVDVSESMKYAGGRRLSKYDYACFAAASLAYLVLKQQDQAALVLYDEFVRKYIPPSSSPSHLTVMLKAMGDSVPEEKSDIGGILHQVAERVKRKGLAIVFTDLLDDPASILMGLRHLRHRRHEVILFHLVDPDEMEFPFQQMTRFEGLEGLPTLTANPRALREAYLQEFHRHVEAIKQGCRDDRIDYVQVDTRTPIDRVLTSYLGKRSARANR